MGSFLYWGNLIRGLHQTGVLEQFPAVQENDQKSDDQQHFLHRYDFAQIGADGSGDHSADDQSEIIEV